MPPVGHVRKPFERKETGIVRVLIAADDQAVQEFDSRALALKVSKDYTETVILMMTSFAAEEALSFRGRKLHSTFLEGAQ